MTTHRQPPGRGSRIASPWMHWPLFLGFYVVFVAGVAVAGRASEPETEPQTETDWQTERAIKSIEALGGAVVPDPAGPGRFFAVILRESRASDADLTLLRYLPGLRELDLGKTPVTDTGLSRLVGLTDLRRLDLNSCGGVTDAGMAHLELLIQLEDLDLQGTRVAGPGLARLRGLKRLRSLALSGELVTDETLTQVRKLSHLRSLLLAYPAVTDHGLGELVGLDLLERLHIRSGRVTDAGLARLKGLRTLRVLEIPSTPRVTLEGVASLKAALPGLEVNTFRDDHQSKLN